MRRSFLALLLFLLSPSTLLAAGHVFNDNFSVLTPNQATREQTDAYAEQVLAQAEKFRKEIALEWLGAELPSGVGRTHINVAFSDSEDDGMTWPVDSPRRRLHRLFLATTPELALGSTLKHEMCHVVLATRFPGDKRLPAWVEEGIASRYDDPQRKRTRQQITRWWTDTGNWISIDRAFEADRLPASDQESYTLATSLVDFLLSRSDKQTLLLFAQDANRDLLGALNTHYRIRSTDDLQELWQAWVQRNAAGGERVAGIAPALR